VGRLALSRKKRRSLVARTPKSPPLNPLFPGFPRSEIDSTFIYNSQEATETEHNFFCFFGIIHQLFVDNNRDNTAFMFVAKIGHFFLRLRGWSALKWRGAGRTADLPMHSL
jgi:hypothetical protein